MRAWRTYKYNEDVPAAIGALKLETDVAVPSPGAGEVRVKVLHAAVNPIDWKLFSGGYHSMCPATFPYVPIKFGRPTPSTRRCSRDRVGSIP